MFNSFTTRKNTNEPFVIAYNIHNNILKVFTKTNVEIIVSYKVVLKTLSDVNTVEPQLNLLILPVSNIT